MARALNGSGQAWCGTHAKPRPCSPATEAAPCRLCAWLQLRLMPSAPRAGVLLLPVFVNNVVQSTLQVLLFACYAGFLLVLLVLFRCAVGAATAWVWIPLLARPGHGPLAVQLVTWE